MAASMMSCLFISSCENDPNEIDRVTKAKSKPEEGKLITAYFSQQGRMRAKLTAPFMLRYQGDTAFTEFAKSLHVDFYDSTKAIESWVDAKYGKYYESLSKVLLRDSVIVINVKGDTLWTDELWWDQNRQKFHTDKPARYHTPQNRILGNNGLEAQQDLTGVIFFSPTGTLKVADSLQN